MNNSLPLPEFIVVEDDPLILMDIRDMLMREFSALPLSLETVADLGELLSVVGRPAVIIAACSLGVFLDAVRETVANGPPFCAILIADPPREAVDLPISIAFVPSPFSSGLLLDSVKNACAHLRLTRS